MPGWTQLAKGLRTKVCPFAPSRAWKTTLLGKILAWGWIYIYIYRDCVPWNGATAAIASLRCPTSILKECMMKRAFLLIRWPDDPQPAKMNTNHCNFSSLEKGQWKPKIPTNSREKRLIKCSKKSVDWAPKPKQVESIQPSVKAYWGQRNTDNRPTEQLDCPGTGSVHTRRPQSRWRAGVSLSGFCQCVVL